MSPKQIVLDPDVRRLQDEGYEVEVRDGHLLVHSVPYVNSQRAVLRGILVTDLNGNVGELGRPKDHQVWFQGEYPCQRSGSPVEALRHSSGNFHLWPGFEAQHRFSNKPPEGFPDYYSKMKSYISIISNEAGAIDPAATPCTFKVLLSTKEDSVFRYWDSASSRANILAVSAKLAVTRVAIIGLGGTGSYVLDLIAKAPVREIHLFDGDEFHQHNAFRSPGAASVESLEECLKKVAYYARIYDAMRTGVVPHPEYLSEENLDQLGGFDFVFLCVDKGPVRKLIGEYLQKQGTPFIDVGMEFHLVSEENTLFGTCRVTLCTPEKSDHFSRYAPQDDEDGNDLYRSNIQVADMNALNATLAVIRWKQCCGFYQDFVKVHHSTYSVNAHSLTRDEMTGAAAESE